jgi:phosphoribosylglycinamide formyltransferase-1
LSGATVHFVTAELDHGPIVLQSVVPIDDADTPETLAARVLATEHAIYPRALRWFLDGALVREGMRVAHRGGEPQLVLAAP